MHFLIGDYFFLFSIRQEIQSWRGRILIAAACLFVGQFRPSSVRKRLRARHMPSTFLFPAERLLAGF
ncbi:MULTISPECIES: hypothetical protein [Paraburkholderia]|uniref:Uncharacterized protein n=1 Tax=Paraburkholderia dipogonis TaxID=1211383 RepID=A0ABW9AX85_9BURK